MYEVLNLEKLMLERSLVVTVVQTVPDPLVSMPITLSLDSASFFFDIATCLFALSSVSIDSLAEKMANVLIAFEEDEPLSVKHWLQHRNQRLPLQRRSYQQG